MFPRPACCGASRGPQTARLNPDFAPGWAGTRAPAPPKCAAEPVVGARRRGGKLPGPMVQCGGGAAGQRPEDGGPTFAVGRLPGGTAWEGIAEGNKAAGRPRTEARSAKAEADCRLSGPAARSASARKPEAFPTSGAAETFRAAGRFAPQRGATPGAAERPRTAEALTAKRGVGLLPRVRTRVLTASRQRRGRRPPGRRKNSWDGYPAISAPGKTARPAIARSTRCRAIRR